jgi:hypothetical protein
MDDFVLSNLYESRNEWCARLVSIMTPYITEGIRSILWNHTDCALKRRTV